jgi:hypothetical protein
MQAFDFINITAKSIPDKFIEDELQYEVKLVVQRNGDKEEIYYQKLPDRNTVERVLEGLIKLL